MNYGTPAYFGSGTKLTVLGKNICLQFVRSKNVCVCVCKNVTKSFFINNVINAFN